jgi:membrane-bound metal-dependent hydrolase YbcI (DUF457 family)
MVALVTALWALTAFPESVGFVVAIFCIIAVMVGAMTPDLDQPTANLWRKMLGAHALNSFFHAFSGGHRHITHSLVGIIGIGFIFRWLITHALVAHLWPAANLIWIAFMIGYISHVAADTFTDRGVPWFWPLPWHVQIPPGSPILRITTGSFVEVLLLRTALIIVAVLIATSHQTMVAAFFK